jgi:hypothetical protein
MFLKTLESIAGGMRKVGKGISDSVYSAVKGAGKKAAIGALALASIAGINSEAKGEMITYDFTSFSQLRADRSPPGETLLNNNGDYMVNGLIPDVMTSIGFGKGGSFVGSVDNLYFGSPGGEKYLNGSYNTNTSTTNPDDDSYNLVLGEQPAWCNFAIDLNGDGNYGKVYESNNNGDISLSIVLDDNELYTGNNIFYIGGERGGVWNLPVVNSGNYVIPNLNVAVEDIYRMRGDANFDNKVDNLDLEILQMNMDNILEGAKWRDGDFNEDGKINFEDYVIMSHNFGTSGQYIHLSQVLEGYQGSAITGGVVPEPTTLGILGLGGLAVLGRRKDKRC